MGSVLFISSNYMSSILVAYCDVVMFATISIITSICFIGGSCFIYVIYLYLFILVSTTISKSNDVRVL